MPEPRHRQEAGAVVGGEKAVGMPCRVRVGVAGKGGAGKSVVAGTVARLLARRGHQVLAVDADPMSGLGMSLGVASHDSRHVDDAAERSPEGGFRLPEGVGPVRVVREHAALAPDGVRLLRYGSWASRGLGRERGGFAPFWAVVHRLEQPRTLRSWTMVGDLSAGPRQPARNWAPYADTFLVVVEPTPASVRTARRIAEILRSRGGVAVLPVANKLAEPTEAERTAELLGERLFASVPADTAVRSAELAGAALIDHAPGSAAARALDALVDRLEQRSAGHWR